MIMKPERGWMSHTEAAATGPLATGGIEICKFLAESASHVEQQALGLAVLPVFILFRTGTKF